MNLPACLILGLAVAIQAAAVDQSDQGELREAFTTLYQSLRAQGGVTESDRHVIEELRNRAAAWAKDHPADLEGLAIELQLSEWLGDRDRVFQLYERLTDTTKDLQYGLAWAAYFQKQGDRQRVGQIHDRLARLFPGDVDVVIGQAVFYEGANLYPQALELLRSVEIDPATNPRGIIALSDCLYAQQQFPEAIQALQSIPGTTLVADPALAKRVESLLNQRRPYPDLWAKEQEIRSAEAAADDLPRAEILTSRGPIVVELLENEAPNTVANFISLAESSFYDGTTFHRVEPNFIVQGGDPNTRPGATEPPGKGTPGYRIPDEHTSDDARNHFTGSLAMAHEPAPNTAGCQFYITVVPVRDLNGKYTVFGRVIEGLDIARSIQKDDVIESVRVIRKRDHEYVPDKLPDKPLTPTPVIPQPITISPGAPAPAPRPPGNDE